MKLNINKINRKLKSLSGWNFSDDNLVKTFQFKDFLESIHFINDISKIAEKHDHHPDILIQYSKVTLSLSTHDEGGVTEKDFSLAEEIESQYEN